ncbi:MAG: efflux RND transporter periplasmic adaptor subunit [Opitutales bacterium]
MKLKLFLIAVVVAGLVVAGILIFQGPQEVPVIEAERGTAVNAVSANVTVTAQIELTIRTGVAGRVTETLMEPGATSTQVQKGTVLARLDPRMVRPMIERLELEIGALERQIEIGQPAELTLQNLRQDLQLAEERVERGTYSEGELAKDRRTLQRLEREIRQQELAWETELAQLERQRRQLEQDLERMIIRAPIDGTLSRVLTVPGDFLFEGDPIARLISPDVQIRASVAEEDFDGITVGQEVLLKFLGLGDQTFRGTVAELLPTSDPQARRREVLVRLDERPQTGMLVAGMTGEASIIKNRRDDAVIIPRRALYGRQVFVVDDGIVEERTVVPGFIGLEQAEIRDGLEPGEFVVAQDVLSVSGGELVTVEVVE